MCVFVCVCVCVVIEASECAFVIEVLGEYVTVCLCE